MRLFLAVFLLSGCASLCPPSYEKDYVCVDVTFPVP